MSRDQWPVQLCAACIRQSRGKNWLPGHPKRLTTAAAQSVAKSEDSHAALMPAFTGPRTVYFFEAGERLEYVA